MRGKRLVDANRIADRLFRKYFGGGRCSEEERKRFHGIYRKVRKPCSCWMCCNPRKFNELTRHERLADITYNEYLQQLGMS